MNSSQNPYNIDFIKNYNTDNLIVLYSAYAESRGIIEILNKHNSISHGTGALKSDLEISSCSLNNFGDKILEILKEAKGKGLSVQIEYNDVPVDNLYLSKLSEISKYTNSILIKDCNEIIFQREDLIVDSIDCDLEIRNTNFRGNVLFSGINFKGNLTFNNVEVGRRLMLGVSNTYNTVIDGNLTLKEVKVKSQLDLIKLECHKRLTIVDSEIKRVTDALYLQANDVYIGDTTFTGQVDFTGSIFKGEETTFSNNTFERSLIIGNNADIYPVTSFENPLVFNNNTVKEEFRLQNTHFKSVVTFDNMTLKGVTFENTIFENKTLLRFSTIEDYIDLTKADINGDILFLENTFKSSFSILDKTILNEFSILKCTFKGKTSFAKTSFNGKTSFEGSSFEKIDVDNNEYYNPFTDTSFNNVSFDNVHFYNSIDFSKTTFKGNASFSNAVFEETVNWSEANSTRSTIAAEFNFKGAHFNKYVCLERIDFEKKVDLTDVVFKDKVLFSETIFKEEVLFENTSFESFVYFGKTKFAKYHQFYRCNFLDVASFENTSFHNNVRFIANKYDPIKSLLIFRGTIFKKAFDFSYDNFRGQQSIYNISFPTKKELKNILVNKADSEALSKDITFSSFRATCCAVKFIFENTNNKLDRFVFHELELFAYKEELRNDKDLFIQENPGILKKTFWKVSSSKKNWWERIKRKSEFFNDVWMLRLNTWSNKNGLSWFRGFGFTLIVAIIFFALYNLAVIGFDIEISCWQCWENTIASFVRFINPTRGLSGDIWINMDSGNGGTIIDFIAKIFIGYGIYQMIQAFRKHSKN